MRPIVVGVDMDDTIVDTTGVLIECMSRKFEKSIPRGDTNDPEFWFTQTGLNLDGAINFVMDYERSMPQQRLKEGVASAFQGLYRNHVKVHVITSRGVEFCEYTESFIRDSGLGNYIQEVHYASNPHRPNGALSKGEICKAIGASLHIDDLPKHIVDVSKCGVMGVLFGDDPWHVLPEAAVGAIQLRCWGEFENETLRQDVLQ